MRLHNITLGNVEGTFRVCARCSESMFKTILVASNGSALADRALAVAERLARESRSHLVLAHIIEVMRSRGATLPVNPSEEWLQKKIRLQVEDLRVSGVDADLEVRTTSGEPAKLIVDIAQACKADLIVAGAGRRSLIGELAFGSVGRRVQRLASCPVLVIPPRRERTSVRAALRVVDSQ